MPRKCVKIDPRSGRILRPGGVFAFADRGMPARDPKILPSRFIERASGLTAVVHVSIAEGIVRAIAADTVYSNIVARIPRWLHALLGPEFRRSIDAFAGVPNETTHRVFADGRVPYELGVYRKVAL